MFTQVDRNLDRAQGGLGIGLSLVRRLMALHGGDVRAESEGANRGSTFVLTLPLATATGPDQPELTVQTPTSTIPSRRVMVVDDNRDAADSLSMLLAAAGHVVRVAYEGQAALKLVSEFEPALVFCDLGMPVISGFDVATELRAHHRDIVLVALTGWGTEEDRRKTREAGFDFHVAKPITLNDIERILAGGRNRMN
ncbi:MAG: response regulator, partial [Steroidobacteraceae bacterium]